MRNVIYIALIIVGIYVFYNEINTQNVNENFMKIKQRLLDMIKISILIM